MMEFSLGAKRKLVDGAVAALDSIATKGRELDRWEERRMAQVVANMEADAYALAVQQLMLFAKRPAERDAAIDKAIAEQPQHQTKEALRQRLVMVKATLK